MKNKLKSNIFNIGLLFFAIGIALRFIFHEANGVLESSPHILSGFGAGIMGVGVVLFFKKRAIESNPEKAKEYEINEKDERNIQINEKASHATWYVTLFALAILSLAFLIMDNIIGCLLALGVLLVHKISLLICVSILKKKL